MTIHYNRKSEQKNRRILRKRMTYCEKIIWIHLRNKQLGYRFLRQYSVDQYIIDFYCPKLKLALEIDGNVHEEDDQKEKDFIRQKYLEQFGIKFIRIKNDEFLGNAKKAFRRITDEIKIIETPPPSSPLVKGRTTRKTGSRSGFRPTGEIYPSYRLKISRRIRRKKLTHCFSPFLKGRTKEGFKRGVVTIDYTL